MTTSRFNHHNRRQQKEAALNDYNGARAMIDYIRPIDTLRTDISETLGDRAGVFAGHYRRKADSLEEKHQEADANKDTPGILESHLNHRHDKATLKLQHVQSRPEVAPGGLLDRQRRQQIKNLEYKQKVFKDAAGRHEARRVNKPEEIQRRIDQLIQKKISAMKRKAERTILREEHGVDYRDRKRRVEVLARLTPEQKRKIARETILLVRKQNIEQGRLDDYYTVDDQARVRPTGLGYDRVIE